MTATSAPHAPYTVSDKTFERIVTIAEELDMPIHLHLHETDEEIATAHFPQIRMFVHDTAFTIYELPVPPSEPLADRPGYDSIGITFRSRASRSPMATGTCCGPLAASTSSARAMSARS